MHEESDVVVLAIPINLALLLETTSIFTGMRILKLKPLRDN